MKFHDELNPKLWDKNDEEYTLKDEVKAKLEEIATAFIEYLDIPADAILDKVITGSSASYNYTEFSDLDLHIIVDFDKVHKDCPVVEGYLSAMKSTFNKEHDIFIHGVPVELYAEKKDQGTVHNGLYSLQTGWIDIPNKIEPTNNDAAVEAKYNELKELIDKCETAEIADELLDKIYTMRKAGLADAGEFSTENLAFKKLRNEGVMNKLRQLKKQEVDKQLSLESYNENVTLDIYTKEGDWVDSIPCKNQSNAKKEFKNYKARLNNPNNLIYKIVKNESIKEATYMDKYKLIHDKATELAQDRAKIDFVSKMNPQDLVNYAVKAIKRNDADISDVENMLNKANYTPGQIEDLLDMIRTNLDEAYYRKRNKCASIREEVTVDSYLKMLRDGGHLFDKEDAEYLIQCFNDKKLEVLAEYKDVEKAAQRFLDCCNKYDKVVFKQLFDNGKEIRVIDTDTKEFNKKPLFMEHKMSASKTESVNESTKKYRSVVADDKYTRYKDFFGTRGRKRTLHVKATGETKQFLSGPKREYKDIKTGQLFYLGDDSDVMTDIMGEPYTKFEIISESFKKALIKESLKDEYKQAFDLLVEGENIVATLDTDFGKQFVKDVENLYKIKSYRLKLSIAKEMLKDIKGYLVDEQYDNYNAKIDKFINNSKNESIREEIGEFSTVTDFNSPQEFKQDLEKYRKEYEVIDQIEGKDLLHLVYDNGKHIATFNNTKLQKYSESVNEDYEWHGPVAKVTFDNGDVIETEINGTDEEIKSYYMGKTFNLGREEDDMRKVVKVEVIRESLEQDIKKLEDEVKRLAKIAVDAEEALYDWRENATPEQNMNATKDPEFIKIRDYRWETEKNWKKAYDELEELKREQRDISIAKAARFLYNIKESVEDVHSNFKSMVKRIVRDFKIKGYPKSNKFYMDFAKEAVAGFKKDWGYDVKISTGNGELILTLEDTYQAVIDAQTHKIKFSDLENSNYMFENKTMGEIKMEHKNESVLNEERKVLVDTDYGISVTMLVNEPNEEHKFVIVDQDDNAFCWGNSEQAVIDEFVDFMIGQEEQTDAIADMMVNEDSIKDERIKEAFKNYLEQKDLNEDCATLEKKMDLVQDDLNAMIRDLSYVDEDTILESLKNSIKEALN